MYEDLRGLGFSDAQLNKAVPFSYSIDFTTTIAAAGTDTKSFRNDDSFFVIDSWQIAAWLPTTQSGATAFSGLPRDWSPTIGSNTMQGLSSLRVKLKDDQGDWFKTPIRADAHFGDGRQPFYPVHKRVLTPGMTVTGEIQNDGALSIQVQVVFAGVRVPR